MEQPSEPETKQAYFRPEEDAASMDAEPRRPLLRFPQINPQKALIDAIDWVGPWFLLPLFWFVTNDTGILGMLRGTREPLGTFPDQVLFIMGIIYGALRFGNKAVAPALLLMALHVVRISVPIPELGSITVSVSNPLYIPFYYLALRYGLDPRGIAEMWKGTAFNWRDVVLVMLLLMLSASISFPTFQASTTVGISFMFLCCLLCGWRHFWAWFFAVGLLSILKITDQISQRFQNSNPFFEARDYIFFFEGLPFEGNDLPAFIATWVSIVVLLNSIWARAHGIFFALTALLIANNQILTQQFVLGLGTSFSPILLFESTFFVLVLGSQAWGSRQRLWIVIGLALSQTLLFVAMTLGQTAEPINLLVIPEFFAIVLWPPVWQGPGILPPLILDFCRLTLALGFLWACFDLLRTRVTNIDGATRLNTVVSQGAKDTLEDRVVGHLNLLFGPLLYRWLLISLSMAFALVLVSTGVIATTQFQIQATANIQVQEGTTDQGLALDSNGLPTLGNTTDELLQTEPLNLQEAAPKAGDVVSPADLLVPGAETDSRTQQSLPLNSQTTAPEGGFVAPADVPPRGDSLIQQSAPTLIPQGN